ncbi:MAG: COG4705 family protein [Marmoricola sp.]
MNTRLAGSKVPEVVALFWVTKALTTAFGESTSDWMVRALSPIPAVLLGFIGFIVALVIQLRGQRYQAWKYWLAVSGVGVFGTMEADVLHVGFRVPYIASAPFFGICLAIVFVTWQKVEGTLSVHTIWTLRRELFYWAAVVGTFAMGTALGDLSAVTFHLGYADSVLVFAALICLPALAYRFAGLNAIAAFWIAYVLTRPVGASVADWLGKPTNVGGVGVGSGVVTAVLAVAIVVCVTYLSVTKADAPREELATDFDNDAVPAYR